jgi:UDPglucose 6-dehydrogenase
MFNTVSGKKIAILGFAFKKDTNDTRESAAIYVCKDLLEEQAKLAIYDPQVEVSQMQGDLGIDDENECVSFCTDAYEATKGAHAVLILTDWDEFQALDYRRIYEQMHLPAFLFDGRNILDVDALIKIGFEASGVGKG